MKPNETMKAMKAAKQQTMKVMMKAAKPKGMKAMKDTQAAKPKSMKAMKAMKAAKPMRMKAMKMKLNVVNTKNWAEEAIYLWRALHNHTDRISRLETADAVSTRQQNVPCKDVD